MSLDTPTKPITRENINTYLDNRELCIQLNSGRWHRMRRNGATKRWKKNADRIRVPFKYGFKNYGTIDESHFYGVYLDPSNVRHVDDIPADLHT